MIRIVLISLTMVFLLCACNKKEGPQPPGQVALIFPEKNSECTTGQSLGANTSRVSFSWQASENTQTYELRVTNSTTQTTQTISTTTTTASLPLEKGIPFSWVVRSRNNQVEDIVSSAVWNFYNSGSITSFAPFPAEILSPRMSEKVFKDINNEVVLSWSGSDLDEDIANFEIYLSTENPPGNLAATLGANATEYKVAVSSSTVYYWSIITKDGEGNATKSGIYSFTVL